MRERLEIANGSLRVKFDQNSLVSGLFIPGDRPASYVQEPKVHQVGIRIDGETYWLNQTDWTIKTRQYYNAPINNTTLVNDKIGRLLEIEDFVVPEENIYIRNFHVVNLRDTQRSIKLFIHQAFQIDSPLSNDTAQFIDNEKAIIHYGNRRAFAVAGLTDIGQSFDQYSLGLFGNGLEGTWRDADDGELSGSSVALGMVDSTLRFSLLIGGLSSRRVYYWVASASSIDEAIKLKNSITPTKLFTRLEDTVRWWRKWLTPAFRLVNRLEPKYRQVLIDNLIYIRNQQDKSGLIITAGSSAYGDIHDGAYAMWPLIRIGSQEEPKKFFDFCTSVLNEQGYLQTSYTASRSVAPTNLPYKNNLPPIEASSMAMVIFMVAQFYAVNKDQDILESYYSSLVKPMAVFLADHMDDNKLPLSTTQDTYTTALVQASLDAAAYIAEKQHDQDSVVMWRNAAAEVRESAQANLVHSDYLIKLDINTDQANAASFFGAFMFGLFDIASDEINHTAKKISDDYKVGTIEIPSSTTAETDLLAYLQISQFHLEMGEQKSAHQIMNFVIDQVSGEQINIRLRSELVNTLLDTINRA